MGSWGRHLFLIKTISSYLLFYVAPGNLSLYIWRRHFLASYVDLCSDQSDDLGGLGLGEFYFGFEKKKAKTELLADIVKPVH
jgi:hypothetical protein